ncbi:MAG: diguanylate cyclase, partial [Egibacteraceae bacterium]
MRILVADDEPTARLLVQATVEQLGHSCVMAEDGEQAWRMIATSDVEVVVSDWLMPGLDGLELCRRIRAREGGTYTYLVLVTSRSAHDHIRAGMDAGADDYLTKPLDPFELETRLIAAERVTSLHAELQRSQNELNRLACTDPLTQLRNRLTLNDDLAALHAQSRRYERSYSLIIGDVDTFKGYNDTYGHQAGDEVLRAVAGALTGAVRAGDTVYRFGGEEFLIMLPEQRLSDAGGVAERLRAAVEDL